MNALSLFNGFGGAFLTFEIANIKINKLYVSEVDKHAIKCADAINPNNINLGDVCNIDVSKLDKIDMIVGGSPCQSFSFAGKRKGMSTIDNIKITILEQYLELKKQNFEFEGQSYLFWEYMRILKDIQKYNPDVLFFLENVVMTKDWEHILSEAIGIKPVLINSSLVSAQNRRRLYWSNIKTRKDGFFGEIVQDIQQPKDKGILLKDILENEVDEKYYLIKPSVNINFNRELQEIYKSNKNIYQAKCESGFQDNKIGIKKSPCLRANNPITYALEPIKNVKCVAMRGRNPENPKSRESGLNTVQMIESRADGKTNCLTTVQKDNMVMIGTRIRRLTPRECFRLQTVPEKHIDTLLSCGVSNSQLYKMCGNGWNINTIALFFKEIRQNLPK